MDYAIDNSTMIDFNKNLSEKIIPAEDEKMKRRVGVKCGFYIENFE
jgi:hypothetical protein